MLIKKGSLSYDLLSQAETFKGQTYLTTGASLIYYIFEDFLHAL